MSTALECCEELEEVPVGGMSLGEESPRATVRKERASRADSSLDSLYCCRVQLVARGRRGGGNVYEAEA